MLRVVNTVYKVEGRIEGSFGQGNGRYELRQGLVELTLAKLDNQKDSTRVER